MLTEAQRHQLYDDLTHVLSEEGAAILMEVVGSVTIAELATKTDLAEVRSELSDVRAELKTDIAGLRAELKTDIGGLRAELKTDIAGVRSELRTGLAEVRAEMAELKAELTTDIAGVRAEMAELKHDLTRTFATLLFVSQGVLVSIVGLLVAFT